MAQSGPEVSELNALVELIEPVFDEAVENGSDDELFASGYLRGHVDLVAAQLMLQGEQRADAFWPALETAIQAASHELNPADQVHVTSLYHQLQRRAGRV